MEWSKRKFSNNEVNRAGDILKQKSPTSQDKLWAEDVLGNWRSLHSYPINTFQATLRDKLKLIEGSALVAQRLKRSVSIVSKLQRFNKMQLSRMQDIGGLRAVVQDVEAVKKLVTNYENSHFKHEFIKKSDYISEPKNSGYRGVHLIYKYKNEKVPQYDDLQVELQIRTNLQHVWATSVETMGTYLQQSLKSSEGSEKWLEFFSLIGSAFAHIERCPPVPMHSKLSKKVTFRAVVKKANELKVIEKLQAFRIATDEIKNLGGHYRLIVLDTERNTVNVTSYSQQRLEEATAKYTEIERDISKGTPLQVVLVSAGSIELLRKAYPNYFLDTQEFIKQLEKIKHTIADASN